jgi:uracil-DNA glycosylase
VKTYQLKKDLTQHKAQIKTCTKCPDMTGPPVTCEAESSKILLIGQAPGDKEPKLGRPFAWTAGKTLFKWFDHIGIAETDMRKQVYMAAVCRCFPGKNPKGGDRVPNPTEITNCSTWLKQEVRHLKPELLLPVGKLAIAQFMPVKKLLDVIGQVHHITYAGHAMQAIPLPHPSGLSTWYRTQPGKTLLQDALQLIEEHPAWHEVKAAINA